MNNDWMARLRARLARLVIVAAVFAGASATLGHAPTPADASPPGALEIAEHALTTSPALLADESPYELIDPVGPGGITQKQAVGEVTASTMTGGLYNDNGRFGAGYGQPYFIPVAPEYGGGLR
jgi:hypothetical protein